MPWITNGGKAVLRQSQKQSCGYCCIGMILNLVDPHQPKNSESSLVAEGKRLDPTAYDRAAMDRVGARPTPIIHAAYEQHHKIPHWGSGTYGNHLAQVLRSYRINAKYHGGSTVKTAMRTVTAAQPLIVLVNWKGGGGHWVVVVSRSKRGLGKASDYTILDPGGHAVVNRGSTNYIPPYNAQGGTFANYFVTLSGRLMTPKGVKLPGM